MLSYKVANSAVRFTQERINLLNTARRLVEALRVMLDNLMYPHMPYGDMDTAEEDFNNTRTNVQKLLYTVLLPSLQKGGYGYVAMEDESLRPVFESLGPSAREQKQKMQRLVRGIREELGEAFGIESDSWPEPSISPTEAVATEEPEIEKQENGVWVGLPTESDLEREIEAWKQAEERILEMYATPRCLEWALSFKQRALPREIRDLIFLHLVNSLRSEHETHVRIGPREQVDIITEDELSSRVRKDLQQHSWFMNPECFGPEIALEINRVYFAENAFELTDARLVPALLTYDPFNLEFPPFNYIKSLTILHWSESGLTDLHTTLKHLCRIKRRNQLKLDIRLYEPSLFKPSWAKAFNEYKKSMLDLLENLRYTVYELIHSGSEVAIWQVASNGWESGQHTYAHRRLTRFDVDLSGSLNRRKAPIVDFFTMTAEEWIQEKHATGGDLDPAKPYVLHASAYEYEINDALRQRWPQEEALEGFDSFSSIYDLEKDDALYRILSDQPCEADDTGSDNSSDERHPEE